MDIGSGVRGGIATELSKKYKITAADVIISETLESETAGQLLQFKQEDVSNLSFDDNAFDTVICTHTLEHIPDIYSAVNELRRVAKHRLVIIVPKQRAYKYTVDTHIHFFPIRTLFYSPSKETITANKRWKISAAIGFIRKIFQTQTE